MVAVAEQSRPLTIADLARFPDDGLRREILLGELVVSPTPTPVHQIVVSRLVTLLSSFVDSNELGVVITAPLNVQLSEYNVVQPDIMFVSTANLGRIGERQIAGAPDMVVEVLSPSTRRLDLVRKMALYASAGVEEYWVVDPDRKTISVLRLEDGHYQDESEDRNSIRTGLLPGLKIDPRKIFAVAGQVPRPK